MIQRNKNDTTTAVWNKNGNNSILTQRRRQQQQWSQRTVVTPESSISRQWLLGLLPLRFIMMMTTPTTTTFRSKYFLLMLFGLHQQQYCNNSCHAFTTSRLTTGITIRTRNSFTKMKTLSLLAANDRIVDSIAITTIIPSGTSTTETNHNTTTSSIVEPLTTIISKPPSQLSSSNDTSSRRTTTRTSNTITNDTTGTTNNNTMAQLFSSTESEAESNRRWMGVFVLFTVPLAWGTYTPVVKYVYTIPQPPVPGLVFSAAYYIVAAISLWMIVLFQQSDSSNVKIMDDTKGSNIIRNNKNSEQQQQRQQQQEESSVLHKRNNDVSDYWYGGIELGMYLFIANVLQVIGLQTVPADRAGFLIQLTTIFVPLLEAARVFVGRRITGRDDNTSTTVIQQRTWIACGFAFTGVILFDLNVDEIMQSSISTTTTSMTTGTPSDVTVAVPIVTSLFVSLPNMMMNSIGQISSGDYLIIMAAVLYSLHVVRLGRYAKACKALPLAASKATAEAILSTGLIVILTAVVGFDSVMTTTNGLTKYVIEDGHKINEFLSSMSTILSSDGDAIKGILPALGAVVWTGWVTCAYTIFAQSYGQSRVQPTEANLIYSFQPLCTALFAFALLGETLSPSGVVGASFIAAAVYIATTADTTETLSK